MPPLSLEDRGQGAMRRRVGRVLFCLAFAMLLLPLLAGNNVDVVRERQGGGGFFLKALRESIMLETLDAFDVSAALGGLLRLPVPAKPP